MVSRNMQVKKLVFHEGFHRIHFKISFNPNTSAEILKYLLSSGSLTTRILILHSDDTLFVLLKLAEAEVVFHPNVHSCSIIFAP